MHARTCTGQEAVSGSVARAAQRRQAIERGGLAAYSCNRGQRCHKYDEGSTRLISPHFAIPISSWTRARIGRQRRRRRPFHRGKPVLAVRQGGSMPCNGFTAPTDSPRRQRQPSPAKFARIGIPQQQLRRTTNCLCIGPSLPLAVGPCVLPTYYLRLTVTRHIAPPKPTALMLGPPRARAAPNGEIPLVTTLRY